ncbi:MAG: LD-carboxypeptidase [Bacteroidetes bacterium]|nr:LD-carboxypeptidase [Bacteroidota bacterium]
MEKLFNRRNFLGIIGTLPFLKTTAFSQELEENNIKNIKEETEVFPAEIVPTTSKTTPNLIIPPILKKGDTVAFTAPASPIGKGQIANYTRYFKEKGCEIIIGNTIAKQKNNYRYFSDSDENRAEEFNQFIADEKIKAIICGRGGYGSMRILRFLDYETLKKNPKIVMGYSDITALLLAIYKQTGITAYHGPVACSRLTAEHKKNIDQLFFSEEDIEYKIPDMKFLSSDSNDLQIKGRLQGGNLTLVTTSLGTPYAIDLSDSLFFIEDTSELAHNIDRMLASLLNAGELEKCKAILVGKMKNFFQRGNFSPNRAFTISEVIEQYAEKVNVPCIYNLPFGHVESHCIFPIGMEAEIDTKLKKINVFRKKNN